MALHPWLLICAQGIAPLCIRHYVLSWLGCYCISMPCPSPPWCNNGPWHCTHGSLSHLAQGIAPCTTIPMADQATSHKSLRPCTTIERGNTPKHTLVQQGIKPPRTRHYTLVPPYPWLIKPPHTSHCTHGLSHLAQGIAPLYHHREGKLHHTTSCGPPYVVEPMLSVGDLTWGPLVWPCPCHLISS